VTYELSEADMALCVSFLDGELAPAQRSRFELRLASEPQLSRALDELALVDGLILKVRPRQVPLSALAAARSRRWSRVLLAVAALVLAVFGVRWVLVRESNAPRELWVAAVASYESPREFIERHASLRGLQPPDVEQLRGEDQPTNVGAAEFAARAAEAERVERAQLDTTVPTKASFFVLPFATPRAVSVLVLAFPKHGKPVRLLPDARDARAPAQQGRFEAGEHVLPSERFVVDAGRLEYRRGFLVPVGAEELEIVVAVRSAPLDVRVLVQVDQVLTLADPRTAATSALQANGFELRTLRVLEAQD
jgi:hypothetical protein